jgi:replication-associated recombination protein RarA
VDSLLTIGRKDKLKMGKYEMITKHGYQGEEVISALQKCVRRGLEKEALFWAVELYESGYQEWCWKRLRIMSSEDVGLAEPGISSEIWSLYMMFREAAKNKNDGAEPQRLFLTHAVIRLCRARKSRLIDWALLWAWLRHPYRKMEVPDVALDKHTSRGKLLKRGWGHFFREGSQLENPAELPGEAEYKSLARNAITHPQGDNLFG